MLKIFLKMISEKGLYFLKNYKKKNYLFHIFVIETLQSRQHFLQLTLQVSASFLVLKTDVGMSSTAKFSIFFK